MRPMWNILPIVGLGFALCSNAFAQGPMPPVNPSSSSPGPLQLTLQDALERARTQSPQILSANIAALLAREDTVIARAALLPNANAFNQFIYTQPNGLPSGVFVSNDGPHVYNSQLQVHGEIYNPAKLADYRKSQFAEAVARAKADVAARGLVATVVQNYYGMVSAARKLANAEQSQREAEQFLDITQKQEARRRGGAFRYGESANPGSTTAARYAGGATRRAIRPASVSPFCSSRTSVRISAWWTIWMPPGPLPPFTEISARAGQNSPDIRAAQATVQQQNMEFRSARAARLPSLSFDYFYGMNSNEVAWHNRDGFTNVGSVAQAQLTIPLWTWGATRSRIRQAELHLQQARNDLSLTQRQLLANLNAFYQEAATATAQITTLRAVARPLRREPQAYVCCATRPARSPCSKWRMRRPPWCRRGMPTTTGWSATAWRWPICRQ